MQRQSAMSQNCVREPDAAVTALISGPVSLEPKTLAPRQSRTPLVTSSYVVFFRFVRGAILTVGFTIERTGQPEAFLNPNQRSPLKLSVTFELQERMFVQPTA